MPKIQSAILPSNKTVKAYLKDSFGISLKDVIAGDFSVTKYYAIIKPICCKS